MIQHKSPRNHPPPHYHSVLPCDPPLDGRNNLQTGSLDPVNLSSAYGEKVNRVNSKNLANEILANNYTYVRNAWRIQ